VDHARGFANGQHDRAAEARPQLGLRLRRAKLNVFKINVVRRHQLADEFEKFFHAHFATTFPLGFFLFPQFFVGRQQPSPGGHAPVFEERKPGLSAEIEGKNFHARARIGGAVGELNEAM
jgi:hypothetical protein